MHFLTQTDDGRIDVVELIQMLRVHDQQVVDMTEFAEEVLMALDANGDNMVSRYVCW